MVRIAQQGNPPVKRAPFQGHSRAWLSARPPNHDSPNAGIRQVHCFKVRLMTAILSCSMHATIATYLNTYFSFEDAQG